jgi:hypothetical protein
VMKPATKQTAVTDSSIRRMDISFSTDL